MDRGQEKPCLSSCKEQMHQIQLSENSFPNQKAFIYRSVRLKKFRQKMRNLGNCSRAQRSFSRDWKFWLIKLSCYIYLSCKSQPSCCSDLLAIVLCQLRTKFFFKKMGQSRPLFHLFCLFKHALHFYNK